MSKFIFKYFFDFMGSQKRWLNQLSHEGYHLVKVSSFGYTFEECERDAYSYEIIYRGFQRREFSEPYMDQLLDSGYNVFIKGLNRNLSSEILKDKQNKGRLYNPKFSPRNGFKEVLIIEKRNDGKPFLALIFSVLFCVPLYALIRFSQVIKSCLQLMLESAREQKTKIKDN
jgi:hypothetical protein